jgi:hypothetical protein
MQLTRGGPIAWRMGKVLTNSLRKNWPVMKHIPVPQARTDLLV